MALLLHSAIGKMPTFTEPKQQGADDMCCCIARLGKSSGDVGRQQIFSASSASSRGPWPRGQLHWSAGRLFFLAFLLFFFCPAPPMLPQHMCGTRFAESAQTGMVTSQSGYGATVR